MPIEVMLSGIAMSFCQASRAASIVLAEAETAKPPSDEGAIPNMTTVR